MNRPESFSILGVSVHNIARSQVLSLAEDFVRSGTPHHLVTVNPEYLVMAQSNRKFHDVLNQADLALIDGAGLAWGAWILGYGKPQRLPGVDVVDWLSGLATDRGLRVFFLGAMPGVAETAAAVLLRKYPKLNVAGTYAGSPNPSDEQTIIERIEAAKPHLLFVAFGAPAQDLWIHRMQPRLQIPVAMGVGGTFDYLSGTVQRAPRWMQSLGLEWCYRLFREPWRWRRMLRLPYFVWLIVLQRLRR